jgi:antitoxin Phd
MLPKIMPKRFKKDSGTGTVELATGKKAGSDSWQIQSAKARFSEVFRRARSEGPQRIMRQGKEAVVMLAAGNSNNS